MLAVGGTLPRPPSPVSSNSSVLNNSVTAFPFLSIQICKTYSFPVSTLSLRRSSLCLFALKKHGDGGAAVLNAIAGSVEEDDVDAFDVEDNEFDENNYDGGELDDDELDVVVPFEELDEWLQKKPLGFGEGKVYDTKIEDVLLEEIESLKKAQQDNISKLKSLALEQTKQLQKDAEAASTVACVRISQLPKKRNIQRDLNAAFKGITGIVNIKPVVFGNKKTKDPICKGLAFVNFKSLEDAKRFMDIYSVQNIAFGKVEKRIKCEIVDGGSTASPKSLYNQNAGGENKANLVENSGLSLLEDDDDDDDDSDEKSWDTDSGDEDDISEESFKSLIASELEEIDRAEKMKKTSVVLQQSKTGEIPQPAAKEKTSVVLGPSKTGDNPQTAGKVKSTHKKRETNKVAKIPGAAQRLKLKEKAMLADVYARYGSKVTSASKGS